MFGDAFLGAGQFPSKICPITKAHHFFTIFSRLSKIHKLDVTQAKSFLLEINIYWNLVENQHLKEWIKVASVGGVVERQVGEVFWGKNSFFS